MLRSLVEVGRVLRLSCREHSVLISRHVDGELSRATRFGLKIHFIVCGPCRHLAAHLRFLRAAARRLPSAAAERALSAARMPDEVRERIARRLG